VRTQQTLNLTLPTTATTLHIKSCNQWVRHPQVEAAQGRLALWMVQGGLLWLSSNEIAGKTHLLRQLSAEHPQLMYMDASKQQNTSVRQLKSWLDSCEHHAFWVLDLPAGKLTTALAYATFHLIERAKSMNRALLLCWRGEVHTCLPELSSRLMMMESVHMAEPVQDDDLQHIMRAVLKSMQWDMHDAVLRTLLLHIPRNLADLLDAVAQLDQYSRQYKVKMNGALAMKVLHVGMADD